MLLNFGTIRLFMMTTNLFVIANVKQLRTDDIFRILFPFFGTSWGVGVLNTAIFNSFHNRVEFLSLARLRRAFGISCAGGGLNPLSVRQWRAVKFPFNFLYVWSTLYVSSAHLSVWYQQTLWVGIAQSESWLCYGLDGPGIESRWGGEIFPHPSRTALGPPSLLYNEYRVFLGCKAAEAWRWTPIPFNAEVKEKVELYLYSLSGLLWAVVGWPLSFPYQWTLLSCHSIYGLQ